MGCWNKKILVINISSPLSRHALLAQRPWIDGYKLLSLLSKQCPLHGKIIVILSSHFNWTNQHEKATRALLCSVCAREIFILNVYAASARVGGWINNFLFCHSDWERHGLPAPFYWEQGNPSCVLTSDRSMQHRTCLIDNNVISDCQNNYAACVGSPWAAWRRRMCGWKSSLLDSDGDSKGSAQLLAANFAPAVIISAEADLETK